MEDLLLVTAAVLALEDGRVLLARRRPGRAEAGLWEFPGGKVEPGETPPESLARELREELGLQVEVGPLLAACDGRTPSGRPLRLLAFQVRLRAPVPPWAARGQDLGEEEAAHGGFPDHDRIAWSSPEDLGRYPVPVVDEGVIRALRSTPPGTAFPCCRPEGRNPEKVEPPPC